MTRGRRGRAADKIGLLGGTFDPPHLAHLVLAESARQELELDQVWFVPAGRPPHKKNHQVSPGRVRLEMLRRALRGIPEFQVTDLEIRRRGPSYTVNTLEALVKRHPGCEWWLLVGGDMLADLPSWKNPERVVELAGIAAMARLGQSISWPRSLPRRRFRRIAAPRLELSSSEIRRRVSRGESIRYLVPDAVERYILRQGLYRRPGRGQKTRSPAGRVRKGSGKRK